MWTWRSEWTGGERGMEEDPEAEHGAWMDARWETTATGRLRCGAANAMESPDGGK